MGVMVEPSIEGVFSSINKGMCVLLFVDESKFCQQYCQFPWVSEEAEIVAVDQEILEVFQIGKVPQWRFFLEGNEIANLVGTVSREQLMEMKQKLYENVRPIR